MCRLQFFLTIFLLIICTATVQARIIHVPEDSPTIQGAMRKTVDDDTVSVAPGVYYERVSFVSNGVTLLSRITREATIDAGGEGHVVTMNNHTGIVDGFVITGSGGGYYGGVFTSQKSQVIRNNIITGNMRGIRISSGSFAEIINNRITNNNGSIISAGIEVMTSASAIIVNNVIEGNPYGIECSTPGPVEILNNTIVSNSSFNIILSNTYSTVSNNIVANSEYGIYFGGSYDPGDISEYVSQYLSMGYNDVWKHSEQDYFAFLGGYPYSNSGPFTPLPGTGEFHVDPLFVDPDNGDYHLSDDSPCIDSGTDAGVYDDFEGDIRPTGYGFDMGADESPYSVGLNLSLTPGSTIVSPGGSLDFRTLIQNNTDNSVAGDYWLSVVLPNQNEILIPEGLLNYDNPLSGDIPGHMLLNLSNELMVPGGAPAGDYSLIGRIGAYPNTILDEESFDFSVSE